MSKTTLDNLFGSKIRVKILKFLFRNDIVDFGPLELSRRIQEPRLPVLKEIDLLNRIGLIKRQKIGRYVLDANFEFFNELKDLILKSSPTEQDTLRKRISGLGRVKLAVISGIFINDPAKAGAYDSVADLLIVGDDISRPKLHSFLAALEAEVGKEIRFTLMEKEEFEYRYGMFDRFIRVLFEGPHEKIINKLGL